MSEHAYAEPGRPSQVRDEMNKLEENLSLLHSSLSDLEGRLSEVLIPVDKGDTPKLSEPRNVLVPHASTLQQHNDRIVEANNRIRDMIGRLEL